MNPERWQHIQDLFSRAVELPPNEAESFLDKACNGDLELRREVHALLQSDIQAQGGLQSAVEAAAVSLQASMESKSAVYVGRRIGPYEIVRELGRGGMGAVFHAVRVDDQYLRSVAIKVVAQSENTPEAKTRFRVERQILATLQHPNIAALLDGGTTEDGLPYIVMEYIEGEPLIAYCRRNKLDVRQRLELFCQLCSAVHHAHQLLVIHRDIKPGNVLVTGDGIPKLLDFGIAKLLHQELVPGADNEPTAKRMTPQYASPEQIRGEQLTTATDIYSLGVLLYEILTYETPYRVKGRSAHEVENAVCNSEPSRLSSTTAATRDSKLRRQLTGDLDVIVSTALRKEPERRYPSVQQFAEDIRRYLQGLPITAREESLVDLASRMVRKNRLAAVAIALLIVSIVTGWFSTYREAQRTEARFREVRKLANVVLYDFHRKIADLPGSTPARELLVSTGLEYLNGLSKDATNDKSLLWEISQAYEQVGDAQGDPMGPNLGHYKDALESYSKALELVERVGRERHDYEVYECQTWLHLKRGDLQQRAMSLSQAVQSYERALELATTTKGKFGNSKSDDLLRGAHERLASAQMRFGATTKSIQHARKARELAEDKLKQTPGPRAEFDVGRAQLLLGNVLWLRGDLQGAWGEYLAAVNRLERLLEASPNSTGILERLEEAYRRCADLQGNPSYFHFGNQPLAYQYQTKALEIAERLAQRDPRDAAAKSNLSIALRRMGAILRETNPTQSAAYYQKSVALAEQLLTDSPGDLSFQRDLANSRLGYANALLRLKRNSTAMDELQTALALQKEILRRSPERTVIREDMFETLIGLADVHSAQGDMTNAKNYLDEAYSSANFLMQRSSDSLYSERCMATICTRLGDYYSSIAAKAKGSENLDAATKALSSYDQALKIWRRWRTQNIAIPYSANREQEVQQARSRIKI
ncbi:MAG TPA: protein kinase [Bryobacteraceae bacterium]|nr:protein kinase [Bryobacteraceae bacterium]